MRRIKKLLSLGLALLCAGCSTANVYKIEYSSGFNPIAESPAAKDTLSNNFTAAYNKLFNQTHSHLIIDELSHGKEGLFYGLYVPDHVDELKERKLIITFSKDINANPRTQLDNGGYGLVPLGLSVKDGIPCFMAVIEDPADKENKDLYNFLFSKLIEKLVEDYNLDEKRLLLIGEQKQVNQLLKTQTSFEAILVSMDKEEDLEPDNASRKLFLYQKADNALIKETPEDLVVTPENLEDFDLLQKEAQTLVKENPQEIHVFYQDCPFKALSFDGLWSIESLIRWWLN